MTITTIIVLALLAAGVLISLIGARDWLNVILAVLGLAVAIFAISGTGLLFEIYTGHMPWEWMSPAMRATAVVSVVCWATAAYLGALAAFAWWRAR